MWRRLRAEALANEQSVNETSKAARYTWKAPEVGVSSEHSDPLRYVVGRPVRLGMIGTGGMGMHHLRRLVENPAVRIAALCDCDAAHLDEAASLLRGHYPDEPLRFSDFRDVNRCGEVEAVMIVTPDHWHALQGIDAMRQGRDAYIEKPLTLTVAEGRRLADVAAETGRICQTGTQQRSSREFRFACALVRNGRIGALTHVNVLLPAKNRECPPEVETMPVPATLDYDMWLGPAPWKPYNAFRCHYDFRFVSDYAGGQMTNWGAHHLDIVQWAMDKDDSGPVQVEGTGSFPSSGAFDTAREMDVTWWYENGVTVRARMDAGELSGIEFVGSEGRVMVGRCRIETEPESLLEAEFTEADILPYGSPGQIQNFLECVRTRQQPVAPAEAGHRSATVCHIGNIAMRLGRRLQWDPHAERFAGDDEANAMLSRPTRAPWDRLLD